jgi:hypothetical protein
MHKHRVAVFLLAAFALLGTGAFAGAGEMHPGATRHGKIAFIQYQRNGFEGRLFLRER